MAQKKTTLQKLHALTAQQNKEKKALIKEVAKEIHAKSLAKFEKCIKPAKNSKYTKEQLEYQQMLSEIPTKVICAPAKEIIRKIVSKITKVNIPPLKTTGIKVPPYMLYTGTEDVYLKFCSSETVINYPIRHPTIKEVEHYLNSLTESYLEDRVKLLNK